MGDIDRNIILRAAQSDLDAFEVIYKEYFGLVSNTAFRIVSRREDAEEVTQDVFMNIYHNLKNFRFESSLKTWIYRITMNTAINHAKKSAKHRDTVEYTDALDASVDMEPLKEEINESTLNNLLETITADQKACIVLRSVEGLSYQQIAETLKIPVNTVRSRIKRARETLLAKRKEVMKNEL